jgi:hypothetical protein
MFNNPVKRMQEACYQMGYETVDFIEHDELMQKLAKVIVREKVMDEEAFEMAKQAFAEGCNDRNIVD